MKQEDLDQILKRKGYAILESSFRKGTIKPAFDDPGKVPDVEPSTRHEPLLQEGPTLSYTGRCAISIKVYRRRLTDPLGDCHKYHIDSLRYAGLIRDDTDAEVSVTEEPHEKVESDKDERVEITLNYEQVYL